MVCDMMKSQLSKSTPCEGTKNTKEQEEPKKASAPAGSVVVPPIVHASGTVKLPGSKSISNRALLLAALADSTTRLTGLLKADDTDRMIESLEKLGIKIGRIDEQTAIVHGCGGRIPVRAAELFIGNAGTAARTLTALLAFAGGRYRIDGIARMRERPIGDLVNALRELGANIDYEMHEGSLPLTFSPAHCTSPFVHIKGNVSSQFLTALLMVSPMIAPAEGLEIRIMGELISRPYVEMTVAMMRRFGATVEALPEGYRVMPGVYRSQPDYRVEADASSASYFLALGALTGGPVTVTGVGKGSLQGDVAFADVLRRMGAEVSYTEDSITVARAAGVALTGVDVDCTTIPDAAMTFVPMALSCTGAVRLTGIGSWRVKETDRLKAMATEMRKFGAIVEEGEDWICAARPVDGVRDAVVKTYDDHRMAMSLSLAAASGATVTVLDAGCTAKTFPEYFKVLEGLCRGA